MRILHVRVPCRNLEASVRFYEHLGLVKAATTRARPENPTQAVVDPHAARLLGLPPETPLRTAHLRGRGFTRGTLLQLIELQDESFYRDSLPRLVISISGKKFEDAIADAAKRGAKVLSEPMQLERFSRAKVACVADPDGNAIELVELPAEVLADQARTLPNVLRQATAVENW